MARAKRKPSVERLSVKRVPLPEELKGHGLLPGDRYSFGTGWERVQLATDSTDQDRIRMLEAQVQDLKEMIDNLRGMVYGR